MIPNSCEELFGSILPTLAVPRKWQSFALSEVIDREAKSSNPLAALRTE